MAAAGTPAVLDWWPSRPPTPPARDPRLFDPLRRQFAPTAASRVARTTVVTPYWQRTMFDNDMNAALEVVLCAAGQHRSGYWTAGRHRQLDH